MDVDYTVKGQDYTDEDEEGFDRPHFKHEVIEGLQQASKKPGTRIPGELIEQLQSLINQFNLPGTVHYQLTPLYLIEQEAYAWQRTTNAQANETDRAAMKALLTNLEENHRSLVIRKASFWESITTGTGNIKVVRTNEKTDEEFKEFLDAMQASIVKLLQGAHGRTLLAILNAKPGSEDKTIKIILIGQSWEQQFAKIPSTPKWTPGSWAYAFNRIRNPDDTSHRQKGAGTGSYVQIDLTPSPELVGEQDEPLYMPLFITLGHELGHAYHNLQGRSLHGLLGQELDSQNRPSGYPVDELEQKAWNDPEEYQNITQNENMLRREHGLPARKYEITWSALRELQLYSKKRALQDRLDRAEQEIPPEEKERVQVQLATIGKILCESAEDNENIPLWSVPGQLEKAEDLMRDVEKKFTAEDLAQYIDKKFTSDDS